MKNPVFDRILLATEEAGFDGILATEEAGFDEILATEEAGFDGIPATEEAGFDRFWRFKISKASKIPGPCLLVCKAQLPLHPSIA